MPRRSRRSSGSGGSLVRRRCCTLLLYGIDKGHIPLWEWPVTWVGVAGFEPAASSSRSQRAMWPTTTLTVSDLPRTVRGRPLAFTAVRGDCHPLCHSVAREPVVTDCRPHMHSKCAPLGSCVGQESPRPERGGTGWCALNVLGRRYETRRPATVVAREVSALVSLR
jgi:hypothetical protein